MRLLITLLILSAGLFGQKLHGTYKSPDAAGTNLYLIDHTVSGRETVGRAAVKRNGSFSFKADNLPLGFYQLAPEHKRPFLIILNPEEKEVELKIVSTEEERELTVIKSNENKALQEFYFSLSDAYRDINRALYELQYVSEEDVISIKEHQMDLEDARIFKKNRMARLEERYPNTFLARALRALAPPDEGDYIERVDAFFADGAMLDVSLIRSPVIASKVSDYLRYYAGQDGSAMDIAADEILMAAYDEYDIYVYCLNHILFLFDRWGENELFEFIVEEYVGDEFDLIRRESLVKKVMSIHSLKLGVEVPDLSIPDPNGSLLFLHDLYKQNTHNLVFFWSSQCPHCMEIMPEVKELYSAYRFNGLEVIAISLDRKKPEWEHAIADEELNWTNLSNLEGWDSESADVYLVSITPTFFVVDKNSTLVGKPYHFDELPGLLDEIINQHN